MSLFDLRDVCIAIGSLATLDIPMVVALIGIYVLKVPYCTLTTIEWFLQALSVIPRGSWGDVARRFTMIRWVGPPQAAPLPPPPAFARFLRGWTCSDHDDEEIPFMSNSSALLVQTDEESCFQSWTGLGDLPPPTLKCQFSCDSSRSQAPRRQHGNFHDEEIPFMSNSSALLVQTDEESCFQSWTGLGDLPPPTLKCQFSCDSSRSQAPRRQHGNFH
ncbi:hypothetical protein F511_21989 [Dorcoceras hygrometricum]|uniref:Uncharacterized protein n=1 Tax=Dorcoceras hygrometricum TaxID=472368 RepID=A0A2Z7CA01_9LAMI|nr:hypothetical protein F511_21989 [Dorcoceras hygrometricum]